MPPTYANDWHHLRVNLLRASSWLRAEVTRVLEPYGLSQPQFNILRILRGQKGHPLSTQEIRVRMVDSRMSDASRLVDRLALKHLVTKLPSQADKRLVEVTISAQGLELLRQLDENMQELDAILQVIPQAQAQQLNHLLDQLVAASAGSPPT
jgi:DNA-binding MarR family transcriptional regulator